MATVIDDRVQETTTTTGTGVFSLAGQKLAFNLLQILVTVTTLIIVVLTVTIMRLVLALYSQRDYLTRTTILDSTNSGSAVNWSAGSKDIFCTMPAAKVVFEDSSNNVAVAGLVDGRDCVADGAKLDGIEVNGRCD